MMGRTHAVAGTAAGLGASLYLAHLTLWPTVIGTAVCTGSALLPDMDHPSATSARTYGPITEIMARFMHLIAGGHRRGTHSLFGVAIMGCAMLAAERFRHTVPAQVALCLVMILALASANYLLKIPGILDDLLPIPAVIGIVCFTDIPLDVIPYAVILGCLAHLLADAFTRQGIPLFWPLSDRHYKLAYLQTNGFTERYIVFPLVTLGIMAEIVWWVLDTAH